MKMNNAKQRIYVSQLSKQIIAQSKGSISKTEADVAATEISKTLVKEGDSLDLRTVRDTAGWIVSQKLRVDSGELEMRDGVVYDKNTNEIYDPNKKDS